MRHFVGVSVCLMATVALLGCANGDILPPTGQTIAGPGKYEIELAEPLVGGAPAAFFYQALRVRPDICVTVLNTGETEIALVLEESIGVSPPLQEIRIPSGYHLTRCSSRVGSAKLLCPGDKVGVTCGAIWRVDQIHPPAV